MKLKFFGKERTKSKQKKNYEFVEFYFKERYTILANEVIDIYCVYKDTMNNKMISKRIKTVKDLRCTREILFDKNSKPFIYSKYSRYLHEQEELKFNKSAKELKEFMEENINRLKGDV